MCNGYHDLFDLYVFMSMDLSDIPILSIEGTDYCCVISGISENEAINVMQNVNLTKKIRTS